MKLGLSPYHRDETENQLYFTKGLLYHENV